jgi:hypothetical protein
LKLGSFIFKLRLYAFWMMQLRLNVKGKKTLKLFKPNKILDVTKTNLAIAVIRACLHEF